MKNQISKKEEFLQLKDKEISILEESLKDSKEERKEWEKYENPNDEFWSLMTSCLQKDLEKIEAGLRPIDDDKYKGKLVSGFKLTKTKYKKAGKVYHAWKACRTIGKKQHVIHIGKSPFFAKTKIKTWLEKNPKVKKLLDENDMETTAICL